MKQGCIGIWLMLFPLDMYKLYDYSLRVHQSLFCVGHETGKLIAGREAMIVMEARLLVNLPGSETPRWLRVSMNVVSD